MKIWVNNITLIKIVFQFKKENIMNFVIIVLLFPSCLKDSQYHLQQ